MQCTTHVLVQRITTGYLSQLLSQPASQPVSQSVSQSEKSIQSTLDARASLFYVGFHALFANDNEVQVRCPAWSIAAAQHHYTEGGPTSLLCPRRCTLNTGDALPWVSRTSMSAAAGSKLCP
jgi:hypothetical protein